MSTIRAPESIFVSDKEGNIVYANKKASKELGYSNEELKEMKIFDIDLDFSVENWDDHWEEVREKGEYRTEALHIAEDGSIIIVELVINHIEHMGKEYHFTFAIDITEKKERQKN